MRIETCPARLGCEPAARHGTLMAFGPIPRLLRKKVPDTLSGESLER